ncbi:MAG: zinc ribbon domain-containing protein [Cyanobacteria bacterium REEB67]|nr:zinc ribbon domain-containing protein [Cyanobacteria bacterium REEB67]
MPGAATNTISCGSCGSANAPDMSFCLSCGKVLSARMAALRKARGVKKRECTSCKRSDELNNRYCIFCGAEIQKRQLNQSNSDALEKFTQEVSSVQDRRAMLDRVEAARAPEKADSAKRPGLLGPFLLYAGLGIATAIGVALLTPVNFGQSWLALTSPVKDGLVVYTSEPFVDVVLQAADKKHYLLGSTGKGGSLQVADIMPGRYLARFSKSGYETVSQSLEVKKGRLNLLGFDSPVQLDKAFTADAASSSSADGASSLLPNVAPSSTSSSTSSQTTSASSLSSPSHPSSVSSATGANQ